MGTIVDIGIYQGAVIKEEELNKRLKEINPDLNFRNFTDYIEDAEFLRWSSYEAIIGTYIGSINVYYDYLNELDVTEMNHDEALAEILSEINWYRNLVIEEEYEFKEISLEVLDLLKEIVSTTDNFTVIGSGMVIVFDGHQ